MEFIFECTCGSCPEQYDVFLNDKQVAYVRLRFGILRVDYSYCGGETIYRKEFDDNYKGCFDNEDERQFYFQEIKKAIMKNILCGGT